MSGPGKVDPPEVVERVRKLYFDDLLTLRQVGADLGITKCGVQGIMSRNGMRPRTSTALRDFRGPDNPRWRTSNLRYDTLHARVVAARGKPNECGRCGLDDPDRRYEWANLTGNYEDVQDYARMCVPCHRRFDYERRVETGQKTSPYIKGGTR